MDTCDGLLGGSTTERRLEIMQDSRVGSFAVAGAACVLLLKYGALVSLLSLTESGKEWVLLLFPMLSPLGHGGQSGRLSLRSAERSWFAISPG